MEHWHGYYHWLIDVLPRWQIMEDHDLLNNATLLVPKFNRPFQKESLSFLCSPEQPVQEFDENYCRVDELLFLSPLNPYGYSGADNVNFLRKKFCSTELPPGDSPECLYLSRRLAKLRRVVNEDLLEGWLESQGFKIVCPETLSFPEQVHLFRKARVVVAPHGAGLTNTVFMPPDSTVIELFPPSFPRKNIYHCYWTLAAACNHRYHAISGILKDQASIDFEIQLDDLKSTMERLK
jgi:capsular polysaccharide biosynthesis protein